MSESKLPDVALKPGHRPEIKSHRAQPMTSGNGQLSASDPLHYADE
jgi:hypothetical protein